MHALNSVTLNPNSCIDMLQSLTHYSCSPLRLFLLCCRLRPVLLFGAVPPSTTPANQPIHMNDINSTPRHATTKYTHSLLPFPIVADASTPSAPPAKTSSLAYADLPHSQPMPKPEQALNIACACTPSPIPHSYLWTPTRSSPPDCRLSHTLAAHPPLPAHTRHLNHQHNNLTHIRATR